MEATFSQNVYPFHRCKILHLVRHAEGVHNVEGKKNHDNLLSPLLFDAQLSPLGRQQVDNLRKHVHSSDLLKRIELVIVSPLTRTIQTALGVFGSDGHTNNASSLSDPPFVAVELCRERLGVHPCDKRRSVIEYRSLFPTVDFSLIESENDDLWKPDIRETNKEVGVRGLKFLKWLSRRPEKEMAVVSHSGFLQQTLNAIANNDPELCQRFDNCELRSMVIVDESISKSLDSSTTEYPGQIPAGLDLPSDVAKEMP